MGRTKAGVRACLCVSLFACSGSGASSDATPSVEAGADTGAPDADTGSVAGDATPEVGPLDAALDATPDVATDGAPPTDFVATSACNDTAADVYVTPSGLPALDPTRQGDVVRCHRDVDMDADGPTVHANLASKGIDVGPTPSGVRVYRISFRTQRANLKAAASTARVYVPTSPKAFPLPVVVAPHPSVGMADKCADSKDPTHLWDVALPWAATGHAVITPDYTGLGNEGVQAYLNNRDQGYAVLDGARALRKLFAAGTFGDQVVIAGFSQGGGASLSAQALASTYGAGGTLAAVVAFAPQWPIRDDSFAFVDLVTKPTTLISYDPVNLQFNYSNHVIWAQRAYGFFSTYSALTTNGGAAFPAATAGAFTNVLESQCGEATIGGALYLSARVPPPATYGDLFDPGFRTSMVACLADPTSAGCTGLAQEFHQHMQDNVLHADPAGAPILYVQGLADTVLPPAREAACVVQKLVADGVTPQVCVDAAAQHTDVTNRNVASAIAWVEARLAGASAPPCPTTTKLPAATCD